MLTSCWVDLENTRWSVFRVESTTEVAYLKSEYLSERLLTKASQ
jgi:hypothetical protein